MSENKKTKSKSALMYEVGFKLSYLKPMYWSTWVGLFFLWLLMFSPKFMLDALASFLGDIFRNVNKKRRRIARININLCFPELSEEDKKMMMKNSFRHQARSILFYGVFMWAPKFILRQRIVFEGQENIDASFKKGRSVIFMAAHSLGLEAAISAVAMSYSSTGTFNPMKNKLINWMVFKGRSRHGGVIYAREMGFRPVLKNVRNGSTMFYLPDEDLGAERSRFSTFFGVEKATVPVLGRLAKSCKADVLPCMVCYDIKTRRYIVHILPPIKNFPTGDDDADVLAMNLSLEEAIRICPAQYFWSMKLFKTRREGEPARY